MASRRDPDADLFEDDDAELEPSNPHVSANRWRHEESGAYSRHAGHARGGPHGVQAKVHAAADTARRRPTSELADFLNESRVRPEEVHVAAAKSLAAPRHKPLMAGPQDGAEGQASQAATAAAEADGPHTDGKHIAVGPLLNYRRMEGGDRWVGSVLVVTRGGGKEQGSVPSLVLRRVHQVASAEQAGAQATAAAKDGEATAASGEEDAREPGSQEEIKGLCLYSDPRNTFWRFDLAVTMEGHETEWEYTLPDLTFISKTKPRRNVFFVPAKTQSMRMMFHSCNGFSVGTDEQAWSGPALWYDVLRKHFEAPFHVMIGGGDQIYNDGIRVNGPLRPWTDIGNPKKRRDYPFPEALRQACDDYYLKNYIRWFGTEPFATANGQIPQLNIWDDHDIIDGFGSYVNDFMKCDVFRGIGGTAHKYYMLFQHHMAPPASTYTTDATFSGSPEEGQGRDPVQHENAYVHPPMTESNYIVGSKPGPYVAEHSHSMYARLGARIAFLGLDARTERTRHQVNYPETYKQVVDRLRQELQQSKHSIKHLIVLLGIPIAYPRLTWLENIFSSPLMGPVKFMNRRFGLGGGFFNHFDGSVDLLDDLDDHYTAKTHKKERAALIERLQAISAEFSVRITILGGDVHLAALGRFYANPALNVPTENDYRYITNVISSAITNKPPPQAIANLLARRNKIHHLNKDTDETLMKIFDKDPGRSSKTAHFNHVTMPSRNYAIITENSPNNPTQEPASEPAVRAATTTTNGANLAPPPQLSGSSRTNGNGSASLAPPGSSAGASMRSNISARSGSTGKNGHSALHAGEMDAGTGHRAASAAHGKGNDGGLDVCIRVEIDEHDHDGNTEGYGLTIPPLSYTGPLPVPTSPAEGGHADRDVPAEQVSH